MHQLDDLMGRDILELAAGAVRREVGNKLRAQLDPLDERFRANTKQIPRTIFRSRKRERKAWWWYRLPLRFDEEMASGLRPRGLAD